MAKIKSRRLLSMLLTASMLLSCASTAVSAAEAPGEVTSTPSDTAPSTDPEGVTGTLTLTAPEGVTVELYNTFDCDEFSAETKVEHTSVSTAGGVTSYVFEELPVGNYNYLSEGEGWYSVEKNIWFSEAKAKKVGGYTINADPGRIVDNGAFQQTPNNSSYFGTIRLQTDEVWENVFGKTWTDADAEKLLVSPYFENRLADRIGNDLDDEVAGDREGIHQQTTNQEMVEWLQMLETEQNTKGYMHLLWYDKEDVAPKHHLYDDYDGAPILVFTKADMTGVTTLEGAAEVLDQDRETNNKVTIQYQAQVHPPEPAATEGALVMARQLANDFGDEVLDNVNVVMIPRFNSDGSYEWIRTNASDTSMDMNRDYHILSCPETRMIVNTFNLFYPEVVIDTHEMSNYGYGLSTDSWDNETDDLQMTGNGGGGLNPKALADLAIEELEFALNNAKENYGIRGTAYEQYPFDVYTTIGAAYPATRGSIGHLIETRGIGAGMSMFERRVMSQWGASSGIIKFAAQNTQKILDTVAAARAEIVAKSATFENADTIILRHFDETDKTPFWPDFPLFDMASGEKIGTTDYTWVRRSGVENERPRPTAYVIPADTANIDKILNVVEGHNIEYYKVNNGASIKLKQYIYHDVTSKALNASQKAEYTAFVESALGAETSVTFANGAYVFPMNQNASTLMGLMFEPDVFDNRSYKSDFIRMGFMEATEGEPLPLYRYEHDLVDGKVEVSGPSSATGTLTLTAPEGVTIELYNTFSYREFNDEHKITPTSSNTANGVTSYVFENLPVGNYNYWSKGDGWYSVEKNIWFSEEKAESGWTINADPGKIVDNGAFQQTPDNTSSFGIIRLQTDEVWQKVFGKTWTDADAEKLLVSPYFVNRLGNRVANSLNDTVAGEREGIHQQTTNKEMVEWLQMLVKDQNPNGYMHLLWYTKENVAPKHDLYADYPGAPVLVFTKANLGNASTLEEVATILDQDRTANNKVTVQYQAQVHPPEPAATEGALVMARQLANDFGNEVLDKVNVVMIPRFNSDGSYEWIRTNATDTSMDMNRDYHILSCPETRMIVNTFNLFYPEVVIDTHEMSNYGMGLSTTSWNTEVDDLQMTGNGGGGLNPKALADLAIEELEFALNNAKENYGIRGTAYQQYPYDVYTTIGAAYPATRGSIGHLIETRGIGAGMSMFERRVMSQWGASSGIIKFAAQNTQKILDTVAEARAEIVAKGATFEDTDTIILRHFDETDTTPFWADYPLFDMANGEEIDTTDYYWVRRSGVENERPRPTAYVIPADTANIDKILNVVEGHNIEYYKVDNGASIKLKQYIYHDVTSKALNASQKAEYTAFVESALGAETSVTFANGAYVFPMNQNASTLMGLMFEPDVFDNRSYKSDFIRMGFMEATEGEVLPLYRYEHDLVDGKVSLENSGSSSGSSSGGGSSSGSSSSSTTKNPDGSTTTTTTNKTTGTVTETIKRPDGSQTVVETKKDGTVTTTDKAANGSTGTVVVSADGSTKAEVKLTSKAVSNAGNEPLSLPMAELAATNSTATAPTVTISTGSSTPVKVEIPVADVTPGTVAVLVKADGTEEIVKTSVSTEDGIVLEVANGDVVKLVENGGSFNDVSSSHWANNAIQFVTARELFAGTGADSFSPDSSMTRAMLMTVLASFNGVETAGGSTWYAKSLEWAVANGISDGSNPDGSITREQLVTMLWRYAGSPAVEGAISGYNDSSSISEYAVTAMTWAIQKGLISGMDSQTLAPQGNATRAQLAVIMMNFVKL